MEKGNEPGFIILNEHEKSLVVRALLAQGYKSAANSFEGAENAQISPQAQKLVVRSLKSLAMLPETTTPELNEISNFFDDYEDLTSSM